MADLSRVIHCHVGPEEINSTKLLSRVGSDEDGAAILFIGVVRNHADGRSVSGMRYDSYIDMAQRELTSIAAEAAERLGTDRLAVEHRIGELHVGEISVAIAVSSP
ncbi:MAG TPA: hypothetical protein DCS75_03310, partial [Gemmatimonadetes bacterium]|nr:hypothetical protein [Gemmatimonadota bacterium]